MGLILRNNAIIKNLVIGGTGGSGGEGGGGGGYSIPIETSGLQLWWDASQYTSGTTMNDLSGNSRNGTISGTPTFNSAGASSYFAFSNSAPWGNSGQGHYIQADDTTNYFGITQYDGLSISVWIEVPNNTDPVNITSLGERAGNAVHLRKFRSGYPGGGANSWEAGFAGSATLGGTSATSNTSAGWKNITLTMSSGTSWTMKMYQNGVELVSASATRSYSSDWFPTYVVGHILPFEHFGTNPEYGFNGNWANAAVYNRELTSSEVLSNFNALSSNF